MSGEERRRRLLGGQEETLRAAALARPEHYQARALIQGLSRGLPPLQQPPPTQPSMLWTLVHASSVPLSPAQVASWPGEPYAAARDGDSPAGPGVYIYFQPLGALCTKYKY